ncbi:FmdB family zinc ribbon protein [Actinocatenispora sera]|uniref:FmdB family zinc ribbon protein n=1 Tax=Actinocatenispora sera TaxID=390989 RepID=UPI0033DDF362
MPTYQYVCTECGHTLEAVQSFSDGPLTECPNCGGRLRKVFSAVGVVFKGSGFYRTDSRSASTASSAAAPSSSSSDGKASSDGKGKSGDSAKSGDSGSSASTTSSTSSGSSSSKSGGSSSGGSGKVAASA